MFVNTSFLMYLYVISIGGIIMLLVERLAEIRKRNKFSQAKIAEMLQIPQQQYCRYENGQNEIPVRYVIKLCEIYGISADWLLGLKDTFE